ncbi:CPBP family intramembrane metalloprotease [Periweissella cryptocerci]|uniref:CPBP family intramembrane metalloprotease n=1 Tax=Periweissella cryptocerci TaxID=2506420 RepID=A0A4P6YQU1_9LACO|nr:CPBP family intramembrane glutamic endopeptidase [Periweissella cryptocerci]QBO34979.1 CPBP family intramembrane metalloprotease [Periweissella cryptocerci]
MSEPLSTFKLGGGHDSKVKFLIGIILAALPFFPNSSTGLIGSLRLMITLMVAVIIMLITLKNVKSIFNKVYFRSLKLIAGFVMLIEIIQIVYSLVSTQNISGSLDDINLAWLIFIGCFCSPIFEEVVYRHFLFGYFLKSDNQKWKIVVVATTIGIIWGLSHFDFVGLPIYFLVNAVLSYVYAKGGVRGSITLHVLLNLVSLCALQYF